VSGRCEKGGVEETTPRRGYWLKTKWGYAARVAAEAKRYAWRVAPKGRGVLDLRGTRKLEGPTLRVSRRFGRQYVKSYAARVACEGTATRGA
jgi:hypothetical protein